MRGVCVGGRGGGRKGCVGGGRRGKGTKRDIIQYLLEMERQKREIFVRNSNYADNNNELFWSVSKMLMTPLDISDSC